MEITGTIFNQGFNGYDAGEINRFIDKLSLEYNPGFDCGIPGVKTSRTSRDDFNLNAFLSEIDQNLAPQAAKTEPEHPEHSEHGYKKVDFTQDWSTIHALQGVKYAPEYVDAAFGCNESYSDYLRIPDINISHSKKPMLSFKNWESVKSIIFNSLFYITLIGIAMLVFFGSVNSWSESRGVLGYSCFTVLSGSMQHEMPVGSLVITKKTDPRKLQIGDNITFDKYPATTVTHKIVGIYENYNGRDSIGFKTQGVNNPQPDKDIVDAANIVGKVVFSAAGIGTLLSALAENLWIAMIVFGLLLILSLILQIFFKIKSKEVIHNN